MKLVTYQTTGQPKIGVLLADQIEVVDLLYVLEPVHKQLPTLYSFFQSTHTSVTQKIQLMISQALGTFCAGGCLA